MNKTISKNFFINSAVNVKILVPIFLFAICILVSCTGDVCGDIWNLSPKQLLDENENVALAKYVEGTVILEVGNFDYLGNESNFRVIEHKFIPLKFFKGAKQDTLILWNCERFERQYSDSLRLNIGDQTLVYGNAINSTEDLFLILSPMAPQEDLGRILNGKKPKFDWATRETDSLVSVEIMNSSSVKKYFQERYAKTKTIIYCPEQFCLTLNDYVYGHLCYYDSTDIGHSVTPDQYLADLTALTGYK